jgi:hypothetical protein
MRVCVGQPEGRGNWSGANQAGRSRETRMVLVWSPPHTKTLSARSVGLHLVGGEFINHRPKLEAPIGLSRFRHDFALCEMDVDQGLVRPFGLRS